MQTHLEVSEVLLDLCMRRRLWQCWRQRRRIGLRPNMQRTGQQTVRR